MYTDLKADYLEVKTTKMEKPLVGANSSKVSAAQF